MRVWMKRRDVPGVVKIDNVTSMMTVGDNYVIKIGEYNIFNYLFPIKEYVVYEVRI